MSTPEIPSAVPMSENPVEEARIAGETYKQLKVDNAPAEQQKQAEINATLKLDTALLAKLSDTIDTQEVKPARYEMV